MSQVNHQFPNYMEMRQTYNQRNEQRMIFCFETLEEAETRARKRKLLEEKGQRKRKRHSLNPKDLEFAENELLQEVNAMKGGEKFKLIICEWHGGSIEWWRTSVADDEPDRQFDSKNPRRLNKVESGEFVLGEMIVPQTFKKVMLTKEGHLKTETFTVSGRKIPLLEIRKRMLKEHESLGIMRIWKDDFYDLMTADEFSLRLVQLDEESGEETPAEMR
ncbi:hypothetical protein P5673_030514 [Acropora cervicornis]|uniref:Uncharacterized protein n=1 Tax=Acropora cervicornis TaxID=6130 RepID=A0AAD9UT79_ACRCE|nr:hypothetical protein P5673_030514 [Acropora cervicornis]